MKDFYNKHYIATDAQGRITSGWSDGPHPDRDAINAICINEQGGYQFRLFPGGEENPPLCTVDGIPLYKWDGTAVILRTDGESAVPRTAEEIEAERVPSLESVQAEKLAQLSAACSAAITAGCDVELPDGSAGHISLTAEDQINLTNARAAVEAGARAYPYHLDGELCALYPAADIMAMARAATAHKLYHTTYYNHLAAGVRRCGTARETLMPSNSSVTRRLPTARRISLSATARRVTRWPVSPLCSLLMKSWFLCFWTGSALRGCWTFRRSWKACGRLCGLRGIGRTSRACC